MFWILHVIHAVTRGGSKMEPLSTPWPAGYWLRWKVFKMSLSESGSQFYLSWEKEAKTQASGDRIMGWAWDKPPWPLTTLTLPASPTPTPLCAQGASLKDSKVRKWMRASLPVICVPRSASSREFLFPEADGSRTLWCRGLSLLVRTSSNKNEYDSFWKCHGLCRS